MRNLVHLKKWAINNCGSVEEFKNYAKQAHLALYGEKEWDYINKLVDKFCNLQKNKTLIPISMTPSEVLITFLMRYKYE